MKHTIALLACSLLDIHGQTPLQPRIVHSTNASRPNVIHLAPRFATAIRMQDVVTSVVIGDPAKFLAEHSEKEPRLVLVKPTTDDIAESNLLVSTAGGVQATFALHSGGAGTREVDFVVEYSLVTSVWVPESREIGGSQFPEAEVNRSAKGREPATGPEMENDLLPGLGWNELNRGSGIDDLRARVQSFNSTVAGGRTPTGQLIPTVTLPNRFGLADRSFSVDFRLGKSVRFGERYELNIFAEVFNALNVANLTGYGTNVLDPSSFGQPASRITQVFGPGGPRAFQFGARFNF